MPMCDPDHFRIIRESSQHAWVCTSLPNEVATEWMSAGRTDSGWHFMHDNGECETFPGNRDLVFELRRQDT